MAAHFPAQQRAQDLRLLAAFHRRRAAVAEEAPRRQPAVAQLAALAGDQAFGTVASVTRHQALHLPRTEPEARGGRRLRQPSLENALYDHPDVLEAAVIGITAMIDGLWLRFGLNQDGLSLSAAMEQMKSMLDLHLGRP